MRALVKLFCMSSQDLLRSELPDSMESALQGDERCVLDTMRLVDLLLVLLFEGRKALPKSTAGSGGRIPGLRRLDSSGERSHRQLIDCIRSKDTDALIDAIDTGGETIFVFDLKHFSAFIYFIFFCHSRVECILLHVNENNYIFFFSSFLF